VLVAATVDRHGYDGLALATMMAGVILMAIGFLRIGAYIKYIPHPVTIGFTAGIAVIIFASQLRELLGLRLPGKEPGPLIPKLAAFWEAIGTINPAAVGVAAATIAVILALRRYRPTWPGFLIAITAVGALSALFHLRSRRSAPASAACRRRCRRRMSQKSRSKSSRRSSRTPSPSRSSAASSHCFRP